MTATAYSLVSWRVMYYFFSFTSIRGPD